MRRFQETSMHRESKWRLVWFTTLSYGQRYDYQLKTLQRSNYKETFIEMILKQYNKWIKKAT
jgi:hypothetical protein